MHSTEKIIKKNYKIRSFINLAISIPVLFFTIYSAKNIHFKYFSDIIFFIYPLFLLFLVFHQIYYYLQYKKKVKKIGLSKFEISEDKFIYIRDEKTQIFNSKHKPKSIRRNFESFIITTKEDKIINLLFYDYGLVGEELDNEKNKFDKLKTNLGLNT